MTRTARLKVDLTPRQRASVEAVTDTTGCGWSELSAQGRGPTRTAESRLILYEVLSRWCEMSDGQIARMLGRSRQAVSKGRSRLDCGCATDCDCATSPLLTTAMDVEENLYTAQFDHDGQKAPH